MTITVSICFCMTVDYRTFRSKNRGTKYHHTISRNVLRMAKHINAHVKSHVFDPFVLISIVGLISNFKMTGGTNGINQVAAIRPTNSS